MVELHDGLYADPRAARGHLVAWLARGAQDVVWALGSVPRSRWLAEPPVALGPWPAARHVGHLSLHLVQSTIPAVRVVLGELPVHRLLPAAEVQRLDAAWDEATALDTLDVVVRNLAESRFALLRLLEGAPEGVWRRPLPRVLAPSRQPDAEPVGLGWLVARSYQHELAHLSSIWRLALYWDRIPPATEMVAAVPLQPA